VHETIRYYRKKYPGVPITVGGIYASLCRDNLREEFGYRIRIQRGLVPELDNLRARLLTRAELGRKHRVL